MKRFTPVIILTAACWLAFGVNNLAMSGHFTGCGIIPRHVASLPAIAWSPFLHVSLRHLVANTVPLLVLGAMVCARGRGEFTLVTVTGIVAGGALTWVFARTASHVGASGLVFCFFGFLVSRAWFDRSLLTLGLAAVCIVGYGGLVRGLLPTSAAVSWEGHAAGLVAGILAAALLSRKKENKLT